MDRIITNDGEQINASDICNTNLFSMVGLAKLCQAVLGNGPWLNNLPCTPTSPASLNVILGYGEIYNIENIDDTTYGPLPINTTNQILKQGIMINPATIAITAPVTVGDSINYLIEVAFQEVDTTPETRPYFGGPPQTVDTIRADQLIYTLKAGIPAPTGTQVTPAPDAGYVGAWVVTVAYGATTIISGNITAYSPSSFIPNTLPNCITQANGDARYELQANFVNSITANGYQYLPGGLILQWLTVPINVVASQNYATATGTFPIAYTTGAFSVVPNINLGAGGTRGLNVQAYSWTTTGFTIDLTASPADPFGATETLGVNVMCIGY